MRVKFWQRVRRGCVRLDVVLEVCCVIGSIFRRPAIILSCTFQSRSRGCLGYIDANLAG